MNRILKVGSALVAAFVLITVGSVQYASARGSVGGRSGGARSFSSRPSVSRPSASKPSVSRPSTPSKPVAPRVTTRPSSATKTVSAAKPKTVGTKTFSRKGSVVDSTYQPRFSGGYSAPVGSTVYYRQSSVMDWLPFYMIMSNQQHREAVVVQPDGKEQVVKEEGTDGMYILNWVITILVCLGLIALVVYLINRYTKNR